MVAGFASEDLFSFAIVIKILSVAKSFPLNKRWSLDETNFLFAGPGELPCCCVR